MTAMALDPIYISMANVPDFAGLGGELALDGAEQAELAAAAPVAADRIRVDPPPEGTLAAAMRSIASSGSRCRAARRGRCDSTRLSPRSRGGSTNTRCFDRCIALHDELPWTEWPEPLARADASAVERSARRRCSLEITYRSYLQWIAAEQWAEAKRLSWPVRVFGDLPFMISADSPDVWARQHEFRFDATIGVPPDAFSETGQDWGLPPWRCRRDGGQRLRLDARARAPLRRSLRRLSASIISSACIASTSGRSTSRMPAFFDPAEEPAQIALGETLIGILSGARRAAPDGDRRRSRIDPAVRARIDGAPRSAGTEGAALGAALGSRRPAADRSARNSPSARSPPRARTTSSRWRRRPRARRKNSAPRSCSRCCRPARA